MNGVEQIAFAHAVISQEAIHLRTELQAGAADVLKIINGKFVENHGANIRYFF